MAGHYTSCPDPVDCWCEVKRLSGILGITLGIFTLEVIGGLVSGSLALLADAVHVLGDGAAVIVTLIAAILIRFSARTEKVRDAAFRINIGLLFLMVVWIAFEAIERFQNPGEVNAPMMIAVAFVGGVGNVVQHIMLADAADEHKHRAHRALSLHVISDLWQSVGVVVGGFFIWISGWFWIDPLVSIGIAVWIARCAIRLALNPHSGHHH